MISGLTYIENAIDLADEATLIGYINDQAWSNALKRRVQHYGYKYNYVTKTALELASPIPEMFKRLAMQLNLDSPDQVIVNEYLPGQGIAPHIDSKIFDKQIATLSLSADIQMDFRHDKKEIAMYLKRRSLVILEGDARYVYTHGIAPRKSDSINGMRTLRNTRISITFRKIMQ